jgi:carbonic anhydrase/acetyltransferase-like protein (isoleucine patch superfamily)
VIHDGMASSNTVLGDGCIVEDRGMVWNSVLGRGCVVGVGALIEGSSIGEGTLVSAKARVIGKCSIGNNCIIGPCVNLDGVTIQDGMSVVLIDGEWQARPRRDSSFSLAQLSTDARRKVLLDRRALH